MPIYFNDKLKSVTPGMVWPAIPEDMAAHRLSLLNQLQETQWWPAEKLEQFQFHQITALLRHAARTVPYYHEILRQAGWTPDVTVTPDLFRQIPVLTRSEVNQLGNRLYADILPKEHGPVSKSTTSGSTGNPVTILKTALSGLIWDVITLRDHVWRQRDFAGTMAIIRHFPTANCAPPAGVVKDDWGPPVSRIFRTGRSYLLNIKSTAAEQLDWLVRINPDYLLTFPSAAEAMVRLGRKRGQTPTALREVRTIGETLSPETRQMISEGWNVPVTDCYSAQETGYLALQAPDADHYLVQSECVYLEVLNEEGQPCLAGEQGRVVVTPLHNFATPLIRYALDDFAEVGKSSACGRGLPVLDRILGRSRNMLLLPDGESRFASFGIKNFNLRHGERIHGFQVVQKTLDSLLVRLVMEGRYSTDTEAGLKQHICNQVRFPFAIHIEYVDQIGRSKGGKYEDFRCEVVNAV